MIMQITITLTDRESGCLLAALRTLKTDYENRANSLEVESRELHKVGAPECAAIREKMLRDQISMAGQVTSLIDRIESAREE